MKRVLCNPLPKKGTDSLLDEDESHHIRSVLRLSSGETVIAMNGEGQACEAIICISKKSVYLTFISEYKSNFSQTVFPITLYLPLIKLDKLSLIIEKATELGIEQVQLIATTRTQIKPNEQQSEKILQKLQKISDQSLKQCERLYRLKIYPPQPLHTVFKSLKSDEKFFIAKESLSAAAFSGSLSEKIQQLGTTFKRAHCLVGPEGGFELSEYHFFDEMKLLYPNQVHTVHLGPHILRAETACFYFMTVLCSHFLKS